MLSLLVYVLQQIATSPSVNLIKIKAEEYEEANHNSIPKQEEDLENLLLLLQCPGCSVIATSPIYQCQQVGGCVVHSSNGGGGDNVAL